jgi:DNA-binding transcriptional ArsR family regulator
MEHSRKEAAMADIARQLAHPLRVQLLAHVAASGPCPFSELVEVAGGNTAQVSNHLAGLRAAGLLVTQRHGRQSLYRLPNSHVAEVLANLAAAAGVEEVEHLHDQERATETTARRCYDHVGGRLGVRILAALRARDALIGGSGGHAELTPGAAASAVLPRFGLTGWEELRNGRRRFAYGCPDWTERTPHLGGALGAAITQSMRDKGWIQTRRGSRGLTVTAVGHRALVELGVLA